jgi:hypothetical protein
MDLPLPRPSLLIGHEASTNETQIGHGSKIPTRFPDLGQMSGMNRG